MEQMGGGVLAWLKDLGRIAARGKSGVLRVLMKCLGLFVFTIGLLLLLFYILPRDGSHYTACAGFELTL